MRTYQVGSGSQQINFSVDVTTLGLAASRAILVDPSSNTTGNPVAHSQDATGDITPVVIGIAGELQNHRLSVFTKVDLPYDDFESRKREFEKITAEYTLNNGPEGLKKFSNPLKRADNEYYTAFLLMLIDLT